MNANLTHARLAAALLPLASAVALAACGNANFEATPGAEALSAARSPIINGTPTSSWPAIGALVTGANDSFCSCTLIAPDWVLTAGHCANVVSPVGFFVGAKTTDSDGLVFPVDAQHPHPGFDLHAAVFNDVALLHLLEPADGVTPLPVNTEPVAVGEEITNVGFGVNVAPHEGSGSKRFAKTEITSVDDTQFTFEVNAEGQLVCFGDSGGPDLVTAGGQERIAGVHSTVTNDMCDAGATSTRVDAYASWITKTMAAGGPADCRMTGGDCGRNACAKVSAHHYRCIGSAHAAIGGMCDATTASATSSPCVDGGACLSYGAYGDACYQVCSADTDCLPPGHCALLLEQQVSVCITPCAIGYGECGAGKVCYPANSSVNQCVHTQGATFGQPCDAKPPENSGVACAEGLACMPTWADEHSGACRATCSAARPCGANDTCVMQALGTASELGVCVAKAATGCGATTPGLSAAVLGLAGTLGMWRRAKRRQRLRA
jgi:hypothetical protein